MKKKRILYIPSLMKACIWMPRHILTVNDGFYQKMLTNTCFMLKCLLVLLD